MIQGYSLGGNRREQEGKGGNRRKQEETEGNKRKRWNMRN